MESQAAQNLTNSGHFHTQGPSLVGNSIHVSGDAYFAQSTKTQPSREGECRILLSSLTFDRMDDRLHNVEMALPETCQWLQHHPHFRAWADPARINDHGSFLWIKGKPGSGKSTVMKSIVAWAQKEWSDEILLTYFFNARSPYELEKSSLGLYRSLLYQLLMALPALQIPFSNTFTTKVRDGTAVEWSQTELQNFWIEAMTSGAVPSQQITLFIDALDEGQDDDVRRMLNYLERLTRQSTRIRICLASRYYPQISVRRCLSIELESQPEHGLDIIRYIHDQLRVADSPQGREIREKVQQRSAGVFLWVVLVVLQLNKLHDQGRSMKLMLQKLNEIPQDLHDMFATIISRDQDDMDACITLLRWVLFALEKLTPIQLYAAVQSTCEEDFEDANFRPVDEIVNKYLLNCSRGLIELTKSTPVTVQFIHESVRDFLTGKSGTNGLHTSRQSTAHISTQFESGICHMDMAEFCLRYFLQTCRFLSSKETECPLTRYTAIHWWEHVGESGLACSSKLLTLAEMLFTEQNLFQKWVPYSEIDPYDPNLVDPGHMSPPLHYAAMVGIVDIVRLLLDRGADVDAQDGDHNTALYIAALAGALEMVITLLESGANIHAGGGSQGTALHGAVLGGRRDVIEVLLEWGADINARGGSSGTALHMAAARGLEGTVQILLDHGADISARDDQGRTTLQIASEVGSSDIEQLLREYEAKQG